MRKFSLVFAAAVMAVGLAVSGSASVETRVETHKAHEILSRGQIILATEGQRFEHNWVHQISVSYNGMIYACMVWFYQGAKPQASQTTCHTDY